MHRPFLTITALLLVLPSAARCEDAYQQTENIVYAEAHGVGLLMDVFTPTKGKNGLGVVIVTSGGWKSGRDLVDLFKQSDVVSGLCSEGYTLFAIRPGTFTRFNATEMVQHLRQGIGWVKGHAAEYDIDPARLGMLGASAGGHLTLLTSATADEASQVKAAAAIFPPTDFLDYGGKPIDLKSEEMVPDLVRRLLVPEGLSAVADEEVQKRLNDASPVRLVNPKMPPVLMVHGTQDELVPLQQSQSMETALKGASVPVKLVVIQDGKHDHAVINGSVPEIIAWFEQHLGASKPATAN